MLYTSIRINEHFWHKWRHLSCDITSVSFLPCQFSILDDVKGWQSWRVLTVTRLKLLAVKWATATPKRRNKSDCQHQTVVDLGKGPGSPIFLDQTKKHFFETGCFLRLASKKSFVFQQGAVFSMSSEKRCVHNERGTFSYYCILAHRRIVFCLRYVHQSKSQLAKLFFPPCHCFSCFFRSFQLLIVEHLYEFSLL